MRWTQANRHLKVQTTFGQDTFLLTKVSGVEAISQPFEFELTLISQNLLITPQQLLKQEVSFSISNVLFHGVIFSAKKVKNFSRNLAEYQITVVPRFYLLKKRKNCKIFPNANALDIIQRIFTEHGLNTPDIKCSKTYPKQKHITQFNESDFDFISRLLEDIGIFYYFRFEENNHVMVLADDNITCPRMPNPLLYHTQTQTNAQIKNLTYAWRTYANQYHTYVYNFYDPVKPIEVKSQTQSSQFPVPNLTLYHPHFYSDVALAQTQLNLASQRKDIEMHLNEGESNVLGLHASMLFQIDSHPIPEVNQEYLVAHIEHEAMDETHLVHQSSSRSIESSSRPYPCHSGLEPESSEGYINKFICVPSTYPYVPPLTFNRPKISGFQSAVVVTPNHRVVSTNKYTDIQLVYHWDQDAIPIWARLAHDQAYQQHGQQWIPRCNQEVIVSFRNGNIDEPMIINAAYNGIHAPAFELPDHKTQTGFKTQSFTRQNESTGANALIFEDKEEKSVIQLQAQKDFLLKIDGTEVSKITGNQSTLIKQGDNVLTIVQGEDYVEANQITFKVGSSTLEIAQNEINLNASQIVLQGAGGDPVMSAARVNDSHSCPKPLHIGGKISQGSTTVLINGQPAARQNDPAPCHIGTDKIKKGASSVFIDNKPATRQKDPMQHGGKIKQGSPNVSIGGGGPAAMADVVAQIQKPADHAQTKSYPVQED